MDPVSGTLALLAVLFGGFTLVKGAGRLRRWRARRRLAGTPVIREARGLDGRLTLFKTPHVLGLAPGPAHDLWLDLYVTSDRLLVATDRGVLLDGHVGGALTSARATAPGRLTIEGEVPRRGAEAGLFRLDLVVDDASGWAAALAPFQRGDGTGTYGSFDPTVPRARRGPTG